MSKKQIVILVVLGALVVVVFCSLGYFIFATTNEASISIFAVGSPHRTPKQVAHAWLEAVAEGECKGAKEYTMPDADGAFWCGEESDLRLVQVQIDQVDVDKTNSPLIGDFYIVTFYGDFDFVKRVSPLPSLEDLKNPTSTPRPTYERHLAVKSIEIIVEEIGGKYYVSPWTGVFNFGLGIGVYE